MLAAIPQAARMAKPQAPSRCLLCGSSGDPIVWSERGYGARQCPCGVIYVDPEPGANEVDPTRDLHSDGYYRLPVRNRFQWLRRFVRGGRLLEVGFGPGHMLSVAREAGFQVSGVDPNRAAVAQARARGFEVELATIETSSLPDRAFDVVFHVDMLNHFPDPICALEAMRRRLRPGGVLVFEVGVIGGLHPRWHWWWGSLDLPEHRQFFSEAALRRLLERAGLEVIETQRFGLLLASVVLRARRLVEPLIDRHLPRPRDATGLPPRARGIHAIYEYVMMATRYSIGRRLPAWGTLTLFVAAREKGSTPN